MARFKLPKISIKGLLIRNPSKSKYTARRKTAMNSTFSVLMFLALGIALVAINAHYIQTLWKRYFASTVSHNLRPFEIVGLEEDHADRLRMALPRMVIARLHSIKDETNVAVSYLNDARNLDRTAAPLRPSDSRYIEFPIPNQFSEPLAIDLEVADVELGWLVSWFIESVRSEKFLDITMTYPDSKDQVHIYGHAGGPNGYSFTLSTKNDHKMIVNEIATAIVQLSITRHDSALELLNAEDFSSVMSGLSKFARLERDRVVSTPSPSQYADVLGELKPLADRLSKWKDLQLIAALSSERAESWIDARRYYGNALGVTPNFDAYFEILKVKIASIDEEIQAETNAKREAQSSLPSARTKGVALAAKKSREAAGEVIEGEIAEPILKAIGVGQDIPSNDVLIAVVGGAPWKESASSTSVTFLGTQDAFYGSDSLRNYQSEIWQTVRMVAPNSRFLFAPLQHDGSSGSGITMHDLPSSLRFFSGPGVERPDIILLALGGTTESSAVNDAIKAVPDEIIVVVASGHRIRARDQDAKKSIYDGVTDHALVAASASLDGKPSTFSPQSEGMVWAPGERIPVVSPTTGEVVYRAGSGFSAALVAGAVSRIVGAIGNNWNADEVRQVLKDMEKSGSGSEEVILVNARKAVEVLKEKGG